MDVENDFNGADLFGGKPFLKVKIFYKSSEEIVFQILIKKILLMESKKPLKYLKRNQPNKKEKMVTNQKNASSEILNPNWIRTEFVVPEESELSKTFLQTSNLKAETTSTMIWIEP